MSETADLGVVDPIRLPGAGPAGALWRRAPGLAKIFVILAALDLVVRSLGVIGPPLVLDVGRPLSLVGEIVPRTLWILLPAIVLLRRPDAWWSTPKLLIGSIILALTTLVIGPIAGLIVSTAATDVFDPVALSMVVSALSGVLTIVAWYYLGSGFAAVRPRPAATAGFVVSNVIAAGAIITAAVSLIAIAFVAGTSEDQSVAAPQGYLNGLFVVVGLVTARAYWIAARGIGDPRRLPRPAWIAGVAGILAAISGVLTASMSAWVVLHQPSPDQVSGGIVAVIGLMGWLDAVVAPGLLVLAIATGLIDRDSSLPAETSIA
ncbi:MAG TPA: hypothetical protein VJ850_01645 [Candidatus Limnocylindrales bacterium]|nr:hypothetical protein [Candidatus Limnocylindrales bacterium]